MPEKQAIKYESDTSTILSNIGNFATRGNNKVVYIYYKQSKYNHISMVKDERLPLWLAGSMTNTGCLSFCLTLKNIRKIVLHDTKSSRLPKIMEGKMSSFQSGKVTVYDSEN